MDEEKKLSQGENLFFPWESFFGHELCPMPTRRQGAETPHINSCTSKRCQARGEDREVSRVMSCSGVDGERFVVSADFISHVKPNNREPHGLPATAPDCI